MVLVKKKILTPLMFSIFFGVTILFLGFGAMVPIVEAVDLPLGCDPAFSTWTSPDQYNGYYAYSHGSVYPCPAPIVGWIRSELNNVGCDTYGCNSPSCDGCCLVGQILWTRDPSCDPNMDSACNRNTCGGTGVILCDGSCSVAAPPCDITPPIVGGFYSPSSPISNTQIVSFTGNASDISGINLISLYIDGNLVKDCISLTSCFYARGPYSLGTHTFRVFSVDNSAQSNNNYSSVYNFIQAV